MKYVIYPIGFVLAITVFVAVFMSLCVGFGLGWHYALGLNTADAAAAGQLTVSVLFVAGLGVFYAHTV